MTLPTIVDRHASNRTVKLLFALLLVAPVLTRAQPAPIFRFETDELWLNLHHYLYVLGRAEAKTGDSSRDAVKDAPADAARGLATLSEQERAAWRDVVTFYSTGLSTKDAIRDSPLPALTGALAVAHDAPELSTVFALADSPTATIRVKNDPTYAVDLDLAVLRALERAEPIYRKAWWPAHRASNDAWRTSTQALVDRHGRAILDFITKVYGFPWPAGGYTVHVSAYANWAGAYSTHYTTGPTDRNVLVISSLDAGNRESNCLETVFHESMHQWDAQMFEALRTQTRKIDKLVPGQLSHTMIFYTAGYAVRRSIPEHVPYADAFGLWSRGWTSFRDALQETWKPYLDGRGTRDEALAALVAKTATEPRR